MYTLREKKEETEKVTRRKEKPKTNYLHHHNTTLNLIPLFVIKRGGLVYSWVSWYDLYDVFWIRKKKRKKELSCSRNWVQHLCKQQRRLVLGKNHCSHYLIYIIIEDPIWNCNIPDKLFDSRVCINSFVNYTIIVSITNKIINLNINFIVSIY